MFKFGLVKSDSISIVKLLVCFVLVVSTTHAFSRDAKELFDQYSDRIFQIRIIELSSGNQTAIGSGFQIDTDGFIVTNFHVVSEYVHHPEKYRIDLVTEHQEHLDLELFNIDVVNDLALLKVEGSTTNGIELADKLPLNGEPIFSLGNPHDLDLTVIPGTFNGVTSHSTYERIHISAAINSGMSGGPTLNSAGQVVGVNVASSGNQIGFLIPLHRLRSFVNRANESAITHEEYSETIRDQLYNNQSDFFNELIDGDWVTSSFGDANVPDDISPYIKCWGVNNSRPEEKYNYSASYCQENERIFLSGAFDTGSVLFQFGWFDTQQLNQFQFYKVLESYASDLRAENRSDEENVTNFKCYDDFVESVSKANKSIENKVSYCARTYKKYPGLYDVMYLSVSVHDNNKALLSHFSITGVSQEAAAKLTKKFSENIIWN
ncbi:MAG: S1C family serine protease [Gammaproteobacteria bacterium]